MGLRFEENRGQADPRARFVARGAGGTAATLFLLESEAVLALRSGGGLRIRPVGGAPAPAVEGVERLPGVTNFYRGADPARRRLGVGAFARVAYRDVYPGIDLVYYGTPEAIEFDLVVHPGGDPRAIRLSYAGQDSLVLEAGGDLVARVGGAEVRQRAPLVYQETEGGAREPVAARYALLADGSLGVEVAAAYDARRALVIDPVLIPPLALDGSGNEAVKSIAVDRVTGEVWVCGNTTSSDLPTGFLSPVAGPGIYVAKLSAEEPREVVAVTVVEYPAIVAQSLDGWPPTTQVGDGMALTAVGLGIADEGYVYVAGSSEVPLPSADRPPRGRDAYVMALDPADATIAGTRMIGGSGGEDAHGVAVDRASGEVYVTGFTSQRYDPLAVDALLPDFPTSGGAWKPDIDAQIQDALDAGQLPPIDLSSPFLVKLGPLLEEAWATYMDLGRSRLALDTLRIATAGGEVAIAGGASVEALDPPPDLEADPFPLGFLGYGVVATRFSASGARLHARAVGVDVSSVHAVRAIAMDAQGAVYLAGNVAGSEVRTTPDAWQRDPGNDWDGWFAVLDEDGNVSLASYLGGSGVDVPTGIAVDPLGRIYIAGETSSPDFPFSEDGGCEVAPDRDSGRTGFACRLSGGTITFSTRTPSFGGPLLGRPDVAVGTRLALDEGTGVGWIACEGPQSVEVLGVARWEDDGAPIVLGPGYDVTGPDLVVPSTEGLLAWATDPDDDPLVVVQAGSPAGKEDDGGFTFQGGQITWLPDGAFRYVPPEGGFSGEDTAALAVSDGCRTARATIHFHVTHENLPVTAFDDPVYVEEGQIATGNVLQNDQDPDLDVLTASFGPAPGHGTFTHSTDGAFSFEPDPGFKGRLSVPYTVSDGHGHESQATLVIKVGNTPPVGVADTYALSVDDVALFVAAPGPLANDSDADGDFLFIVGNIDPRHGDLTLLPDGQLVYHRGASFEGTDTFGYYLTDGYSPIQTITVTIVEGGGNTPPVAQGDIVFTTGEEIVDGSGVALFDVLANDVDPDGDLIYVKQPFETETTFGGRVTIEALGNATYKPARFFTGVDTFTYRCFDGTDDSNLATVTIHVTDAPPIARADAFTARAQDLVLPERVLSGDHSVLANDEDPDATSSGAIAVDSIVLPPEVGQCTISLEGQLTYRAPPGFAGTVHVWYRATDGWLFSQPAEVTITITNTVPEARDDAITVNADGSFGGLNVLANDSDADGDALRVSLDEEQQQEQEEGSDEVEEAEVETEHGVAVITLGGDLTYTPAPGYTGPDLFIFQVTDGYAMKQEEVRIDVVKPVFEGSGEIGPAGGTITGPYFQLPSVEYAPLAPDSTGGGAGARFVASVVVAPDLPLPPTGEISPQELMKAGPAFEFGPSGVDFGRTITLTLPIDANPAVLVPPQDPVNDPNYDPTGRTRVVRYGRDGMPAEFAPIEDPKVVPDPDAPDLFRVTLEVPHFSSYQVFFTRVPPRAGADAFTTAEDTALSVAAEAGVLANDADPDGNAVTAELAAGPAHGTLSLAADGSFTYAPAQDYSGADSFRYVAKDAYKRSAEATVSLTVSPRNDAPVARADAASTTRGAAVTIAVLANDSDVDGDALAVASVGAPAHGSAAKSGAGITYTPASSYTGTDTFTYVVSDGRGGSATGTVTVTIAAPPPPPPPEVVVPLNVQPRRSPNVLRVKESGHLVVAVLGTASFDARKVDLDSLTLEGLEAEHRRHPSDAVKARYDDVGTPSLPMTGRTDPASCNTQGPDGKTDLVIRFDRDDLIDAIEARLGRALRDDEGIVLHLAGRLTAANGGTAIRGEDVVRVERKKDR